MSEAHESFIKTPRQLITVVVLAFVVPVLIIALLTKFVGVGARTGAGSEGMTPEAIEARIQPVAGFVLKGAGGPKTLASGADVYKTQCSACHAIGAAGAPKFEDAAAWAPRIKTGLEALIATTRMGLAGPSTTPWRLAASSRDAQGTTADQLAVASSSKPSANRKAGSKARVT